jgi:hypothetical protein
MAVGDFTAGSVVSVEVDPMVLPAVFMVDALAVGVTLGEGSDITDFMVIPFMGTTATLTATTDAIIRLGLRSAKCDSSFEDHDRESPSVIYLAIDNGIVGMARNDGTAPSALQDRPARSSTLDSLLTAAPRPWSQLDET